MAKLVKNPGDIKVGDYFESCSYHPCLCIYEKSSSKREWIRNHISGISLVNGSIVECNIKHCGLRKLSLKEAISWKISGPKRINQEIEDKWWINSAQTNK